MRRVALRTVPVRSSLSLCIAVVVAWSLASSCGDNIRADLSITASSDELRPALVELAKLTPYPISVGPEPDPDASFEIVVVRDESLPAQAYRLETVDERSVRVLAPDVLGAQYGVSATLEGLGFVFRHPFDTYIPRLPASPVIDEELHRPDVRVRGFQLHTLHPIEAYFAFWEPSERSTEAAHRIVDWTIKNRGNYIQWVALDDILDPTRHAAWKAFTRELIDYAHLRGIRVGLNIQLFGASNLQLAYDLVDEEDEPIEPQIAARLPFITEDLPFDVYDLSFGEFFNSEPQSFIDAVNEVHRQLEIAAPNAEMHVLVHVGDEQRVTYNGEELLYYFLVKFANPDIIPDIHTVMFYNLFEPAGGAYHHEDFSEHRQFLLDRMCNGLPHAYQPETAYWVAFDNSVPQFFPLYVHNRWLDLDQLAQQPGCGRLDNHMLFSTGWEWGYWMNDTTALRASYERPASPRDLIATQLGQDLAPALDAIVALIDLQREHLMLGELVQYVAGRDLAIDGGRALDIVSQPDRVTFDDLVQGVMAPATFEASVLAPLATYTEQVEQLSAQVDALDLPDTRWTRELRDGFRINGVRARFMLALYAAVIAHLEGDEGTARRELGRAEDLMAEGQAIVDERHGDLHDPQRDLLLEATTNRTFYQFGYLYMADTLCYWNRELVQVGGILGATSERVPSCLFD